MSSAHAKSDSGEGGPNSLCSRFGSAEPFLKKMFVVSHVCASYAMASSAGAMQDIVRYRPSFEK